MTKVKIQTPYFGDRPYDVQSIQGLVPFKILSLTQGSFEFVLEVEEDINQEQLNAVVEQIRLYIIANLINGSIIS